LKRCGGDARFTQINSSGKKKSFSFLFFSFHILR